MFKAKILVVGPCESGKSMISNFLSDQTDAASGDYRPTQGVRILEFEASNLDIKGRNANAEVELWDCSGDKKFEACWAAFAKDSSGILFVFNPDQPNHDKELETWYLHLVQVHKVKDSQCMVFAHSKSSDSNNDSRYSLPQMFSKIPVVRTNIEDDADSVRGEFHTFLTNIFNTMSEKREQEELSIMGQR